MELALAALALVFAAIPALLFLRNLQLYKAPGESGGEDRTGVSVLIPARDEEHTIARAVDAVLRNEGVPLEVVVLDDGSSDRTAAIVRAMAAVDGRVRLLPGSGLPAGWCGKQHACSVLASEAKYPLLCFIDADVTLQPDALRRMAGFLRESGAQLVSGFPRQDTGTWGEKLLIPLVHFVLLGFLPVERMRRSTHPSYAAGCGQLFLARRDAYKAAGGHAAIRDTLHDGIQLPKAFRRAGFRTDIFDATGIASCRMYTGAAAVWQGLAKNAVEGLAAPARILPVTLLLGVGQAAPLFLVLTAEGAARQVAGAALVLAYLPRVLGAFRFRQSSLGALLHPFGIVVLLALQWYALGRHLLGRGPRWKGRTYAASKAAHF